MWIQNLSAQIEAFQNHIMYINTDRKLIEKVKITTLRNVNNLLSLFDTIHSKSSELFGHIKRTCAGFC